MAPNVQFSAFKSSMSTCISANFACIHCAFNENTVNMFCFRADVFYGVYIHVWRIFESGYFIVIIMNSKCVN